ncbi:MAG: L,D-transpeptidase Cds6 family protein [Solidesulfovibrio sp. DCME]|uniref:L,D-transpeptidase Cds6 family protein n=1 Tax=Solidesulfovibrio sp. DCME TaxID=3447380 RepID=UPI003D0A0121
MKRLGRAVVLASLLLLSGRPAGAEWTADIVDMEWSPQRFIAVDKKAQSFALLTRQSPLKVLEAIPCATGQELGDKFKEGDLKTPEGVYFITRRKSAGLNYELYGDLAFPLNFPNPADMVRRKSGHGIWIHGRGHPIIPYETQGCVALSTPDIHRVDPKLSEGMPVVIADEVRLGGPEGGAMRDEAREVVEATKAWAKAWENRSSAFFDLHDPEKFALTEGKPFASFRSHKERLFKSLPWIKVEVSDLRALPGPDYWVTFFVQVYQSPTLISQGIKRLYWQRGPDRRFRVIGMEYEEMPVTLAASGGKRGKASPDEMETDTRKPDSPSEEEVQARQLVDAHQAVMERVAQKAFASVNLKAQPTPEDQAILDVAEQGAIKPGFSPFASDALRQVSPPPAASAKEGAASAQAAAGLPAGQPSAPAPGPAVATAPALAVPSAPVPLSTAAAVLPTAAKEEKPAAPTPAASAAPVQVAAVPPSPTPAPLEGKLAAPAPATVPAVAPAKAAEVAAVIEAWRAAWERGDIAGYLAFYADGARQGNLRGKDAIRRQKEGVWRGISPGRVSMEILSVAPEGDGYAVVCAMDYQGKGRRESKGFKSMSLIQSGGKLLIAQERWSRGRPEPAVATVAPVAPASAVAVGREAAAPAAMPASAAVKPDSAPAAAAASPSAPATVARAAQASVPPVAPAVAPKVDRTGQVASLVESWRTAWEHGRVDDYAGFYAADAVQGDRRGRSAIRDQKAGLWKDKAPKQVTLSDLKIRPRKDGFVVTCVQDYRDRSGGSDKGLKTLYLAPAAGSFAIVEEKWSRL